MTIFMITITCAGDKFRCGWSNYIKYRIIIRFREINTLNTMVKCIRNKEVCSRPNVRRDDTAWIIKLHFEG